MLIGLAAAMIGGILGFLFGVPRPEAAAGPAASLPVQPSTAPAAGEAAAAPAIPSVPGTAAAALRRRRSWQFSTNLTEISWLTKIIVGVGLVEAKAIFDRLSGLSYALGGMMFDGAVGTRLVIPSIIIASALVGFLYAYLFTQLVVAGLVARTDAELGDTGAPPPGSTIVPDSVQRRKEHFSDYIQDLVDRNDDGRPAILAMRSVAGCVSALRRCLVGPRRRPASARPVTVASPASAGCSP
jgi:hypothetical protein